MAEESPPPLAAMALAELRRRDEERGVDPRSFTHVPSQPSVFGPAFQFPPWDGSSFVEPVQVREPDPPLHAEDTEILPAKPRSRSRTPNLDTVREWRAEQMRAAP